MAVTLDFNILKDVAFNQTILKILISEFLCKNYTSTFKIDDVSFNGSVLVKVLMCHLLGHTLQRLLTYCYPNQMALLVDTDWLIK